MKTRLEFPALLIGMGLNGRGAEIGVLFGEYSTHLLANWPGTLILVDPWINQDPDVYLDGCNAVSMNRAMKRAMEAVSPFINRVEVIRDYSVEAAQRVPDNSLDWVYLDGNHALESVRSDISVWWPKVRSGGIIAGHDYYERHDAYQSCGVKQAVDEFAAASGLKLNLTTDDTPNSWWFVKP